MSTPWQTLYCATRFLAGTIRQLPDTLRISGNLRQAGQRPTRMQIQNYTHYPRAVMPGYIPCSNARLYIVYVRQQGRCMLPGVKTQSRLAKHTPTRYPTPSSWQTRQLHTLSPSPYGAGLLTAANSLPPVPCLPLIQGTRMAVSIRNPRRHAIIHRLQAMIDVTRTAPAVCVHPPADADRIRGNMTYPNNVRSGLASPVLWYTHQSQAGLAAWHPRP